MGVLAHIPIGQYNLPVPLTQVLVAAIAVVAASFGLIYLRPPRHRGPDPEGKLIPAWVQTALAATFAAYIAFILGLGLFGRQQVLLNPGALLFWVWTIPLLPAAHVLVGGVYELGNPFAFAAGLIAGGRSLPQASALVHRAGYWPAVVTLAGLIWAESIPGIVGSPLLLGMLGLVYVGFQVSAGVLLGRAWYAGGDVFTAMTALASTIAPARLYHDTAGMLRLSTGFRPPGDVPGLRGREALITLWLAGVLADGIRAIPFWKQTYSEHQAALESMGSLFGIDLGSALVITIEIAVTWAAFALFFWVFATLAARLSGRGVRAIAEAVGPSLVPIALAYLLAHNLTQLAVVGPLVVTAANASAAQLPLLVQQGTRLVQPGPVWWTQVTLIVGGHVLAVVMAHAALGRADPEPPGNMTVSVRSAAFRADLGWLAAMVLYTATSLWVLAQPITRD